MKQKKNDYNKELEKKMMGIKIKLQQYSHCFYYYYHSIIYDYYNVQELSLIFLFCVKLKCKDNYR
jgi:hypothetical protein